MITRRGQELTRSSRLTLKPKLVKASPRRCDEHDEQRPVAKMGDTAETATAMFSVTTPLPIVTLTREHPEDLHYTLLV